MLVPGGNRTLELQLCRLSLPVKTRSIDVAVLKMESFYKNIIIRAQMTSSQEEDHAVRQLEALAQYLTNYDSAEGEEKKYRIIVSNNVDDYTQLDKLANLQDKMTFEFENNDIHRFITLSETLTQLLNRNNKLSKHKSKPPVVRKCSKVVGKQADTQDNKELGTFSASNVTSLTSDQKQNIAAQKAKQRECLNANLKLVMDFLKERHYSTRFIYDEIERIRKTGIIRDKLRRYVYFLEQIEPLFNEEEKVQNYVYLCYRNSLRKIKQNMDLWSPIPNNLILDIFNDYMKF